MIFFIILMALAVICGIFTARYNLHMFQLNGYKNREQMSFISSNPIKQWVLFPGMAFGVLVFIFPLFWMCIIGFAWFALVIWVYSVYWRINTKKRLVYTKRLKRLIVTDIIICGASIALVWVFLGFYRAASLSAFLAFFQIFIVVLSNIVNSPIEKSINNGFIKDAKRMLASVPDIKIIGITGSYGKTSVKYYIHALLSEKYNCLMTPESFNTPMGVVRTIREGLTPMHEIFICEMGARHVGDIKELCDIVHPQHGIITSIGPQHLETFFSLSNIINTKYELGDAVRGKGLLFLNHDNENVLAKSGEYTDTVFYGTGSTPGYYAKDIRVSPKGTEFIAVTPSGEEEQFSMHLLGAHNVANVMGAIACAHEFGISLKSLKAPVRRLAPAEHRLQMIERGNITIIDDAYNSNPAGSKAAVETLRDFSGIRILITPGMVELGDREDKFNHAFGEYAASCCDYILLVGGKRVLPIEQGALSKGFSKERLKIFTGLEDALHFAYSINEEGHKFILLENDLPDNY